MQVRANPIDQCTWQLLSYVSESEESSAMKESQLARGMSLALCLSEAAQ